MKSSQVKALPFLETGTILKPEKRFKVAIIESEETDNPCRSRRLEAFLKLYTNSKLGANQGLES